LICIQNSSTWWSSVNLCFDYKNLAS
jgi:hypothetical protein